MRASSDSSCDDNMAARMQQSRVNGNTSKMKGKTMKRKNDIASESTAKKSKESPYNEIEFKFHLKDPSTIFLGFEKFKEAAVNWSNGEGEDIVVGYCRSSPDCSEIFKILGEGSRKLHELQLIFGCLEKILLRIADDLNSKYYTTGQTIVKNFLANHSQAFFSTLNMSNRSIQIKTSLKFLISMIMLGSSAAKLVLNNIDLSNKVFQPLFQRRDVKDNEDVRTCMTHLILACLLAGDKEVISKVIQTKGVMENLFTGMEFDRIDSLQLVLSTVLEKVILNAGISKTAKAHMFTEKGLAELGRLYNWQGLSKWKLSIKRKGKHSAPQVMEDPGSHDDEDKTFVAKVVDKFLMEVCTSYKHGIIFLDKKYGMSGRSQNQLITGLLRSLSGQLSHILVEKLVISILTACPDQLQYFLPNILNSLLPRETTKWIATVNFLMKVYSSLEKNMTVLKLKDKKPVTEMVQILLVYTLPPAQILNTVLPGIKDKSVVVNHVVIGLVQQLASNAVHVLKSLKELTIYSQAEITELDRLYKAFVCKNLPDVVSVSKCFDNALALQTSKGDELSKLQDLCGVKMSDVVVQVEQVLCLYQELQPALLDKHPVILEKLLDGIMGYSSDVRSTSSEVYVLKLLAGTQAKRLPWGKKNSSGHSLLYQLLKMLTQTSTDAYLSDVATHLICKLLQGTGQFVSHEDDLQSWLNILKSSNHEALDFVCTVMMTYIHNPFPYMDRMSDLDIDVTMETEKTNKKVHSINDILKMGLGDLDDCAYSDSESVSKKRFPFCPLLLVAMETLEKMETISDEVKMYTSKIVLHTFYQQSDPVPLCCMLSRFRSDLLLPRLQDYILTWKLTDNEDMNPELSALRYQEFLSANDNFMTEENDGIETLQEHLLHLNYLIRLSSKVHDKKVVKLIKSRKKNLMLCCQDMNVRGDQTVAPNNTVNVSNLLLPVKPNPLVSGLRLVLNNPVIKHYFLCEGTEDQSKISGIMTDLVKDVLRLVVQLDCDVNNAIQFYYRKVLTNLQKVFKGKEANVKITFKILTCLVPKLSDEQCREIFDIVLNTKCSESIQQSNYLVPLLTLILESLIKSKFKSVRLTGSGMDRLVGCLVGEDNVSELFMSFFKKFPILSVQCSEEVVETLMSADLCSLVEYLMKNNMIVSHKIREMIISGCLDTTCESHLHIILSYLRIMLWKAGCQDVETKVNTKLVKRLKPGIISLCGTDEVEHSHMLLQITQLLSSRKLLGEKLTSKMMKKLSGVLKDGATVKIQHIDLLCMLYDKEEDRSIMIQQCVQCMLSVLPLNNDDIINKLISIVSTCTQADIDSLISSWTDPADVWCPLVENTLNFAYTKPSVIKFLTSVISVIYKKNDLDPGLTLEKVMDSVINNGSFLPIMFNEIGPDSKEMLVSLVLCIVEMCPQVCHTDHISVYLGAYNASLSITDQKLLKLLHIYEQNEISFTNYRPFLWGEKAQEQHTLRKSLGPSLKGVTPIQVVENFDIKLMTHSILKFPLRRKLQESDPQPADTYKSESECYDPCFVLSLMSHLVQPECVIDCRRFTEKGCLGYVFAALSSHDENVRNIAVHVLRNFQGHMAIAKLQEREQLKYLVELVLRSLPENNKLSSIISQFLARASKLLLKLDEYMYTIVNSFLLTRPTLDVKNVPEFFKLFNSSALQYQTERSWILTLMYDGMRESADYWIYEKRFIYKLLQSFYMSCMADVQSQVQVLNIMMTTCGERRLAMDLCQNHGFLIWIAVAISKLPEGQVQPHQSLCKLLHIVWCSVVDNKQTSDDKLQLAFSVEMLTCLKNLLLCVRDVSDVTKLVCVKTLSATLKHIQSMSGLLRGHVSQTVSHSDILLLLLHCQNKWTQSKSLVHSIRNILNSLGRDTSFIESLNAQKSKKQDSVHVVEEMEVDQATGEVRVPADSVLEDDVQVQIAEEIFQIIDVWKMSSPVVDSDELAAVDAVVLRWLLDYVGHVTDVSTVFKTVNIIRKILTSDTNRITKRCAYFITTENSSLGGETLVDIFNMYTVLAEKYHKLSIDDLTKLDHERCDTESQLNNVLMEILTLKANLKDDTQAGELTTKLKDDGLSEEMKSIYVRQMFIEHL